MLTNKSAFFIALVAPLVLLTGCPNHTAADQPDSKPDAGNPTPTPAAMAPPTDVKVNVPLNPLGSTCGKSTDCTSGFCTDGVCCDSNCGQTCYACNLPAAMGHCAALTSGEDPNATPACAAPSVCVLPSSSSVPECKVLSPLGSTCGKGTDCTSGFCTDGVCCDSNCGQSCYACDLPAAMGHCAAITGGEDPNATPACVAPSACALLRATNAPECKLVDGSSCQADGDCISTHCLTYYVDSDGDGYGTSVEAHFCEELNAAPPHGYAAYSGDCCDLDAGANPGFDATQFLAMPDACGSYDWNCNGVLTQQNSCPTTVACGQACTAKTLFIEACN